MSTYRWEITPEDPDVQWTVAGDLGADLNGESDAYATIERTVIAGIRDAFDYPLPTIGESWSWSVLSVLAADVVAEGTATSEVDAREKAERALDAVLDATASQAA